MVRRRRRCGLEVIEIVPKGKKRTGDVWPVFALSISSSCKLLDRAHGKCPRSAPLHAARCTASIPSACTWVVRMTTARLLCDHDDPVPKRNPARTDDKERNVGRYLPVTSLVLSSRECNTHPPRTCTITGQCPTVCERTRLRHPPSPSPSDHSSCIADQHHRHGHTNGLLSHPACTSCSN